MKERQPHQNFQLVSRTKHFDLENGAPALGAVPGQFAEPAILRRLNAYGCIEETRHYSQSSLDLQAALGGVIA